MDSYNDWELSHSDRAKEYSNAVQLESAKQKIEKLESKLIDLKTELSYSKEMQLKQLVNEILISIDQELINQDYADRRFEGYQNIDFKDSIINLKKYIKKYIDDNRIRLD